MSLRRELLNKQKALTVAEVADLLGISIRAVYKEVEEGRIPYFKVRTSIRFDPHQLSKWLHDKMIDHIVSGNGNRNGGSR